MRPITCVFALAVLLVLLLSTAESAKKTCPSIANITANVVPFSSLFPEAGEEIESDQLLFVSFIKTGELTCECDLFEITENKKHASVKNCFGGFALTVLDGMYSLTIKCKKSKGCSKIKETLTIVAQTVDCGHPGVVDNGGVNFSTTGIGAIATFFCDDGYQLEPYPGYFTVCLPEGVWSGDLPTCAVDCGPAPQVANSTRLLGDFFTTVGSFALYFCDFGTDRVGNSTIYCREDGTWDDPPMCVTPVDCGPPPEIDNGNVFYIFTTVLSSASYSCDFGYSLNGNSTIFCNDNGQWDPSPTCIL